MSSFRPQQALLWAGLLQTLASGCRFSDPPLPGKWSESLAKEHALPAPTPLAYRVGIAPLSFGYDARDLYRDDAARNASQPDPALFRRELRAALEASALFTRAEPRGAEADPTKRVEALAWAENDDLLLEVEFLDYHQAFLGHGDGYVPWLLTYVFWIFPAWWMPGDSFGTELVAEVRLRDVQGRHEPLFRERFRVRAAEVAQTLTPSERDWAGFLDVGALWNIQESLEENNWSAIERWVGPHARRLLCQRILRSLEEQVARPLRGEAPALEARLRKRLGLVVGVDTCADARLGGAPHAVEDAEAMAELWTQDAGGGLDPERDLHLLVGEQATRNGTLEAIAAIGSQTAPSDEVVIYLAGQGTTLRPSPEGPSQARLLLHDANRDDLAATTLSLEALGAAIRELPARRVVLFLDASFCAPVAGSRTLTGTTETLSQEALEAALDLGPGRAVLLAARSDQAARVLEGGSAGLFSQVLREGITGRADLDKNGQVSLSELFQHSREEVLGRAGFERSNQEPFAIGLDAERQIGWPR